MQTSCGIGSPSDSVRYPIQETFQEKDLVLKHSLVAAMTAVAMLATSGCSVFRGQQTVGTYVDDTTVTTRVKAKFAEDKAVSAMAISVETFDGVVQLSGFAKSGEEKTMAESIARNTSGVKSVKNDIVIRSGS